MFSKKHRLSKTADVQKVFSQGRAFFNPLLTLRFLSRPGQNPRFTVVVSTKVAKSAVKRNRIKRVIREFARLRLAKFKSGDYMIIVKPGAVKKQADDLRKGFEELAIKAKLFV